MGTLFDAANAERRKTFAPLADRMRPRSFDEVAGQPELAAPGAALRRLVESGNVPSMIFWGPPGSGKTTLAKLVANVAGLAFTELSAVTSGLAEVRNVLREAGTRLDFESKRSVLFIDEIHRFNKGQQDAFLPFVENGTIILIGATTENPSFEVNSALLSRARVFVVKRLEDSELRELVVRALTDKERGLGNFSLTLPEELLTEIVTVADGDARRALNVLELLSNAVRSKGKGAVASLEDLQSLLQRNSVLYDKTGEEHYNIISALHKAMRGSDHNAALYWMGRMLEGGEEPLYIARRLVRFASEDIGLADPNALVQAVAGYQACHFIGMPECNVILAQVVAYLAKAPKSNALYVAYDGVRSDIRDLPNEPVPLHIRNAPTKLMKNLGYGKGYKYNPDFEGPVDQDYLPDRLKGKKYL
ncbi:replication-associated recombination protein A [Patescibacteria group bacterium]|nr:replication-associated recombination protein A [Patescibacteria group bacterium]